MDITTVLTVTAALAGILGFLYIIVVGQKSFPEWLRERRAAGKTMPPQALTRAPFPPHIIQHNLPHRGDFVGREKEKLLVHAALRSRSFIITIDGIGGIGKTSLALEVLHECLAASQNHQPNSDVIQRFDAFIWTSAKDHELKLNDVLDTIAWTLDYPSLTQLVIEEKRTEVVKRLQEKPCLLIVDNFETITDEAIRDFVLNLPEPGKCLITSRTQSLRQARAISLRGMAQDEALLLIQNEGHRLDLNLAALVENERLFLRLYESTGGAPLAIRWAVGQIKQRGQSLEGVLNSLHEAHGDIFEFMFKRAWSLLSPAAVRILTIMPVFASSASKAAIEAASDIHKWELDEGLGQLVELWLVEASDRLDESKRRYSLHPLTRAFAHRQLTNEIELEHRARIRLAQFFEKFSRDAGGDTYSWEKYDEIEQDEDNIFSLLDWCFERSELNIGVKLTRAVALFMGIRGYVYEARHFGWKAIEIARKQNMTSDLAFLLLHAVGWHEIHGGNPEKGEAIVKESLKIYQEIEDYEGLISALHFLGRACLFKGDYNNAKYYFEEGLKLGRSSQNDLTIIRFKKQLAILSASEGDLLTAKTELETIVPILRIKDRLSLIGTLGYLADVNCKLGLYEAAFKIGKEGLEMAMDLKKRDAIGWLSDILAIIEGRRGNHQSAVMFASRAIQFYEKSGLYLRRIETLKTLIDVLQQKP